MIFLNLFHNCTELIRLYFSLAEGDFWSQMTCISLSQFLWVKVSGNPPGFDLLTVNWEAMLLLSFPVEAIKISSRLTIHPLF